MIPSERMKPPSRAEEKATESGCRSSPRSVLGSSSRRKRGRGSESRTQAYRGTKGHFGNLGLLKEVTCLFGVLPLAPSWPTIIYLPRIGVPMSLISTGGEGTWKGLRWLLFTWAGVSLASEIILEAGIRPGPRLRC